VNKLAGQRPKYVEGMRGGVCGGSCVLKRAVLTAYFWKDAAERCGEAVLYAVVKRGGTCRVQWRAVLRTEKTFREVGTCCSSGARLPRQGCLLSHLASRCYNLFACAPHSFLLQHRPPNRIICQLDNPTQLASPIIGPERPNPLLKPSSRGPLLRLP
jgi:hypothetical protein